MRLTSTLLGLALAAALAHADNVKPRPAPEFPQKEWLNTTDNRPLHIEELRGKVVLVEFLTYG